MSPSPLDEIKANVPGLDLWQPRDWPHRSGDELSLNLHAMPLPEDSPGRRSHPCENCGQACLCIHDNVLCWKCKGAFCFFCTGGGDPQTLCSTPLELIVERGFAKCPQCQEPLRSIALIDVFRTMMEDMASQTRTFVFGGNGSSLVKEAEDALARGLDISDSNKEQAILEFTHAINAVNYLTSSSSGTRLVLRAFDILLIAHGHRAELEDNQALVDSILAAYPRASVKTAGNDEKTWYLTQSAYETLFYPLQANLMAGSRSLGGLVIIDQKSQSLERALECDELKEQMASSGYQYAGSLISSPSYKEVHPSIGFDPTFDSLNGVWRGLVSYEYAQPALEFCEIGNHSVAFWSMIQFIWVFSTNLAANEYTRIRIVGKDIGEENWPLAAKESPRLMKMVKRATKESGMQELAKIGVIRGQTQPAISVMATVGNVATKIFVHLSGSDVDDAACYIATKSLAYLERQLKEFRTTSRASARNAPHYHPDLTVCAYCGKDSEERLKTCSRCKLSRYCSFACQKKHWEMKGQFGHTMLCKSVVKANKRK